MKARGPPAAALRPARLPVAHQLRVDPRRDRAATPTIDYSQGVAITSSFHPDEHTHVEPVRYGKGSNAMSLHADRAHRRRRPGPALADLAQGDVAAEARNVLDLYDLKHWSERTVIALVMQTLDNSITTYPSGPGSGVAADLAAGPRRPEPDLDPGRPTRPYAGWPRSWAAPPGGSIGEPFNMPLTAHFIGGCTIGDSPGDRRRRPLPAGLRPPRPAHRRRLGDLGQPRA